MLIRINFFMMTVMKHWNMLTREVVYTPSLQMFKVRSDRVLSNLVFLKMCLLIAERTGVDDL